MCCTRGFVPILEMMKALTCTILRMPGPGGGCVHPETAICVTSSLAHRAKALGLSPLVARGYWDIDQHWDQKCNMRNISRPHRSFKPGRKGGAPRLRINPRSVALGSGDLLPATQVGPNHSSQMKGSLVGMKRHMAFSRGHDPSIAPLTLVDSVPLGNRA